MAAPYMDEATGGIVYYVHPSHSDDPSRSSGYDSDDSDASDGSMTTIGSDEAGEYVREIFGRRFHVDENLPLAYPVDNEELLRHDLQHASVKLLLGGNQWGPISECLAPTGGRRRRVLDICTRSGTWVKELANERPDVDFVSVDLAPMAPHTPNTNIEFEVYNILDGIRAPDATFDMVHCRFTATTFRDYRAFLPEIRRVLRSGGLFLFEEQELEIFDASDPQLVRPATNAPGLTRFVRAIRREFENQGISVRAATQMPAWLDALGGFQPAMRTIRVAPNGLWHPNALMHDVGLMAARIWKATTLSLRPMLQTFGMPLPDAEALTQAVLRDLRDPNTQTLTKYHMIWARRGE
ncbi:methyltransferase domain protein [Ceratobasidium sp. AG-Ba]|nr:methyltransferase domain protein [Ceratobasidium sp. AG-Ba]